MSIRSEVTSRIKYTHLIGSVTVIEGTITLSGVHLVFEMAMTESASGPAKGVLKRSIPLHELESVQVRRRVFRKSKLIFGANNVSTFRGVPGAKGFTYDVLALAPHTEAVSFVREIRFEMAQARMNSLTDRIDSQLSD